MTTPRKPAKRADAMRKAFEREFGRAYTPQGKQMEYARWVAFKAGAKWQRRRKTRS